MINTNWISKWIQPQHLTEEALSRYHQSYIANQHRILVIRQFLREEIVQKLFVFLMDEGKYKVTYGLYSSPKQGYQTVSANNFLEAEENNRFRKYRILTGTHSEPDTSPNELFFLNLRTAFCSPQFTSFFEVISDLSLGHLEDFQVHYMKAGDYLRPHSDVGFNRRLALSLYLNPHWKANYGGALYIVGHDGQVTKIDAEYNTLVFFDVTAHKNHYVAEVSADGGEEGRLSINGWINNRK